LSAHPEQHSGNTPVLRRPAQGKIHKGHSGQPVPFGELKPGLPFMTPQCRKLLLREHDSCATSSTEPSPFHQRSFAASKKRLKSLFGEPDC